jgi:hypothetical protein
MDIDSVNLFFIGRAFVEIFQGTRDFQLWRKDLVTLCHSNS